MGRVATFWAAAAACRLGVAALGSAAFFFWEDYEREIQCGRSLLQRQRGHGPPSELCGHGDQLQLVDPWARGRAGCSRAPLPRGAAGEKKPVEEPAEENQAAKERAAKVQVEEGVVPIALPAAQLYARDLCSRAGARSRAKEHAAAVAYTHRRVLSCCDPHCRVYQCF